MKEWNGVVDQRQIFWNAVPTDPTIHRLGMLRRFFVTARDRLVIRRHESLHETVPDEHDPFSSARRRDIPLSIAKPVEIEMTNETGVVRFRVPAIGGVHRRLALGEK